MSKSTQSPLKITELPMLCKAFALSDGDNGNFRVLNKEYVVPERWRNKFMTAEGILMSLKGKTVKGLLGKNLNTEENRLTFEPLFRKDLKPMPGDNDAFENVALPVNDADEVLLRAHGCSNKVIKMVRDVLYGYFDGELSEPMHVDGPTLERLRAARPKIVVVLEVMWGMPTDKVQRWFHINPYNHSGRRLIDIIGHQDFRVTNACPQLVHSARSKGKPSKEWLSANLSKLQTDIVIVCGNVAQATFEPSMASGAQIVKLPHPAARSWSKKAVEQARRKVAKAVAKWRAEK